MTIENAHFTADGSISATLNGQQATIPVDPNNADYARIMGEGIQVAAYNMPAPLTAEQWRETASLDRRGFCIWLLRAGVLTAAESVAAARGDWPQAFSDALAGLPENVQAEAQIEWATAVNIRRNHSLLEMLRQRAGIPHEVLDEAFGYA